MKLKKLFMVIPGLALVILVLIGCGNRQPEPIKINVDNCDHCKMTVADLKFATELITDKGRVYKFDDIKCMVQYKKDNNLQNADFFVPDHNNPANLLKAEQAIYVKGDSVRTPMNGYIATFSKQDEASVYASQTSAAIITWEEVIE